MLDQNGSRRTHFVAMRAITCLMYAVLFSHFTLAQQSSSINESVSQAVMSPVDQAIKDLADGKYNPAQARILADANVQSAIPGLETKFDSENDYYVKASVAMALIKLHAGNPKYWNYMQSEAEDILKSTLPTVALFDANGQRVPKTSDTLMNWAKEHEISPDEAAQRGALFDPAFFMFLSYTGDRRAIPILEHALESENLLIHPAAAMGLVIFDESPSMTKLIETCRKDPPYISIATAKRLAWSSLPEAQHVAAMYMTGDEIDNIRKEKASGRTIVSPVTLQTTQP